MLLPLGLVALMAVHFWRIRKDGGLARPLDADQRLGPVSAESYPVFSEAPRKTYSLAALVRGRTPVVGRGPENTVPSMPHLFYGEMSVFMLTVFICLVLSLFFARPLRSWQILRFLRIPPKLPGTSWVFRSSYPSQHSWVAPGFLQL
jgi:hypothetical protein